MTEQKLEQELMADLEAKAQELLPCPFCGSRPAVDQIAPHIRQRLYWVANTIEQQHKRRRCIWPAGRTESANGSQLCRMGHAGGAGLERHARYGDAEAGRPRIWDDCADMAMRSMPCKPKHSLKR